jgi:hypothetical protein
MGPVTYTARIVCFAVGLPQIVASGAAALPSVPCAAAAVAVRPIIENTLIRLSATMTTPTPSAKPKPVPNPRVKGLSPAPRAGARPYTGGVGTTGRVGGRTGRGPAWALTCAGAVGIAAALADGAGTTGSWLGPDGTGGCVMAAPSG